MTNPILPGFYPDPTICRVGDDYFLATSSFEYFPGVPIFHSTDLVSWTQLGHAFDRESQLRRELGASSAGIFAPTLRHHDGLFWLVTTNVSNSAGHLILTAEHPAGPWSEPVLTDELEGIDPDVAWDDDGRCYLTWSSYSPEMTGIAQVPIDPRSGLRLGEPRLLWKGTGLAWPESPHLYHVGDWWYLLIAEGGTERGHCISIARSASISGPFEGAPQNPIFSHRSTASPVQNVGHGDFVQTTDGGWAMVYLAARPAGITPGFHVNGRETFLAGVEWVDGWPVIDEQRYAVPVADTSFVDDFSSAELANRWITPGPEVGTWAEKRPLGGMLLNAALEPAQRYRILATRTQDTEWTSQAVVDTTLGDGRMILRVDDEHWCAIAITEAEVTALLSIKAGQLLLGRVARDSGGAVTVWMRARVPAANHNAPVGPDVIELGFGHDDDEILLGSFDGRYLSTEVAGGFTGRVVGVMPDRGRFAIVAFSYVQRPMDN